MPKFSIEQISITSEEYPELLKHIAQPPQPFYYKGNIEALHQTCIAFVGTRKNSIYGEQCTKKLIAELKGLPITIVSGLAYGIDSIAHRTALENGLKTVAVLAHGFKFLHPVRHRHLSEQILNDGGGLLTEFEFDMASYKNNFLQRNRIISGLCAATCVIECPYKSGAINTAYHAFDQNREVFVLPGDITREQAQGPLLLLQQNKATPISSMDKVLEFLNIQKTPTHKEKTLDHNSEEAKIYSLLQYDKTITLQKLTNQLDESAAEIARILTILELKGDISKKQNGYLKVL